MRRSSIIMLAGAIVLAIVALVIARMAAKPSAGPKLQTRPTVVAAVPFSYGDRITAQKLAVVQMPAETVPTGAFASISAVAADGNRLAQRPIAAKEIITASAITGSGSRLSNLGVIDPNMRAISVSVSEHTGVAGLIGPGDRVDVFVTRTPAGKGQHVEATVAGDTMVNMAAATATATSGAGMTAANGAASASPNGGRGGPHTYVPPGASRGSGAGLKFVGSGEDKPQPITDILVQDARVLAMGQTTNPSNPKAELVKTATLEVTPLDAAKLALGEQAGTLTLVLRGTADDSHAALASLHTDDLHDGLPHPMVAVAHHRVGRPRMAKPAGPTVEVIRGGGSVTYTVPGQ